MVYIYIHTHIYIQWDTTQPSKRQSLAICDNMHRTWGYYAKWNKSDGERQISYDFSHMWSIKELINKQTKKINEQTKPKKNEHIDTEHRVEVTKRGGWNG